MDPQDTPVSHVDLYHKLGKLEGMMEAMASSVSAFQVAIKDIHSRIDAVERRQSELEKNKSTQAGALTTLTVLGKDFAIPVLAIAVTWLIARNEPIGQKIQTNPTDQIQQHSGSHLAR